MTIGTETDLNDFFESQRKPHHIQYGDKREIFKRYQIGLDQYDSKLIEVGNLKKLIAQHVYDMEQYKSRHKLAISQEVDAGNVPKFKNAEARSGELSRRLRDNPEYQQLLEMFESAGDQLISGESKLDSLRKLLKFYEVNT